MPSARPKTSYTYIAPQQIDRDTFSQYSTAIKERSQLQERKAELEIYMTALRARIAQIAVHAQEPQNDSLLLALEQEYTSDGSLENQEKDAGKKRQTGGCKGSLSER